MAKLTVQIVLDWEGIKSYVEKHDIVDVVRCKDCKYLTEKPFIEDGTIIWCRRREDGR